MAEKVEDLNLPASSINRIVREALPDGVSVSKETKTAIARAASIFILYATTCANNFAIKSKRKTITVTDIFQALQDMELEEFIPELKECLEAHKQDQKEKKEAAADRKRKQVAAASTSAASDVTDMVTDNALLNTADGEGEGGGGEGGGGGDDVCLVTDEQMEVENGSAAEPLSVS